MSDRVKIEAEPRTVLGKQVKQLRLQGRLPANIYGRALESRAIDVDAREFARNIKAGGIRGMFELTVSGESASRYVVIRGMTRKGGMGDPIHVDFYQIDPNRPITANVPLRLDGVAPAVRDLAGVMVQSLDMVSIRALPLDIPEAVIADISGVTGFDTPLTVGGIQPGEGIEILTDPSIVVAVVNPPRVRGTNRGGD